MREVYDYWGHPLMNEVGEAVSQIVRLLDRHKYSDQSLYIAQECLIDELVQLEAASREFKAEVSRLRQSAAEVALDAKDHQGRVPATVKKATKQLYEEAEGYEEARRVLQYGRWLLRYVGDGVAWHAFGHNRRLIRALASKQPVPAVADPDGMNSVRMLFRATRRLGREWLPVLHDITNCLRTADLSVFQDGTLFRIMELKMRKGQSSRESDEPRRIRHDDRAQRQEERLQQILKFMETKDLGDLDPDLAGGKALDSSMPERHNFDAISRAMKIAREQGYGLESPEDGVLYLAWDVEETEVDSALSEAKKEYPETITHGITFRSISARYEEHHHDLPVTAMALPADDVLDITMGRLGVIAIVNFSLLEKYCSDRGVPLKVHTRDDKGYSLRVESEAFDGEVLDGLWDRVMLEALSLESFTGLIRTIIDDYSGGLEDASA